jgi:hypothetical protein
MLTSEAVAPFGLHMSPGWQAVYTLVLVVAMFLLGAFAIRLAVREHDPLPIALLVGGALCTVLEPMVDVLGRCWYPQYGQVHLFETFSRPIPVYVLFGYTWFMGGLTIVAYRLLQTKGPGALLRLYPLLILVEAPFELLAVHTQVYVYYGSQPLSLWAWPVWWGFVNTAVPILAAVLFWTFREELRGWRLALVVPALIMVDAGVNAAAGWPVWTVLHASSPASVRQIAGLATCLLGLLIVSTAVALGRKAVVFKSFNTRDVQRLQVPEVSSVGSVM